MPLNPKFVGITHTKHAPFLASIHSRGAKGLVVSFCKEITGRKKAKIEINVVYA